MKIDWISKLQGLLQTTAFCLAVAAILYAFNPERPYAPAAIYSLLIGLTCWGIIDLGRHLIPSAADTGWPAGAASWLLVTGGIAGGFAVGMTVAGWIVRWYGWEMDHSETDHWRVSVLITVLACLAGTFWFYSRSKRAWLERQIRESQRQANEARLKLLEAQLEPHMLFNTLANLRALIGVDPQRAQQMLDHMIAYLRATLDGSRNATHPLAAEFDRLRDYLALMAVRMGPRLAYALELPPALAQAPVPTLLLQPLVENSIRHGLEPKVEGGRILVRASEEAGMLVLEVVDTGLGGKAGSAPGFGLEQIRQRLATLYGATGTLTLAPPESGGMRAVVRLPLETA